MEMFTNFVGAMCALVLIACFVLSSWILASVAVFYAAEIINDWKNG